MRLLLFALALFLAVHAPEAQTSFGGGPTTYALTAPTPDGPFAFDGSAFVAGFHGDNGWLHGLVGTDTSEPGLRRRVAGADLALGLGSITVLTTRPPKHRRRPAPRARLSVPFRLSGGYRYLNTDDGVDERTIHTGDVRLGLGAGLEAHYPLSDESPVRALDLGASAVGSTGITGPFEQDVDIRGLRDLAVTVDLTFSGIGGRNVGVLVGYQHRRTSASLAPLGSAGDFVDVLTDGSTLYRQETYGAFRLGLIW